MGTWTFSGDLEVEVAAKMIEDFKVEKVDVVRYIDGKEIERKDIMLDAMVAHNTFSYNWNPTYEIPYGSKQEIFVEVTMRCGMVYRSQISSCGMDEKGNPIDDNLAVIEASIYDVDGNLLYSVDEELYRWFCHGKEIVLRRICNVVSEEFHEDSFILGSCEVIKIEDFERMELAEYEEMD